MHIGVISDTHIPEAGNELPAGLYTALEDCELILHCGDLHSLSVVDDMERLAPCFAARGNGDTYVPVGRRPGVPEDHRVMETRILTLGRWRIGLIHDLEDLEYRPEAMAPELLEQAFGEPVDIALCGHTHVPMVWGLATGAAILNPGSPNMPHGYWHVLGTVGFLDLDDESYSFRVVNLASGAEELSFTGPGTAPMQRGLRPDWRNPAIRY